MKSNKDFVAYEYKSINVKRVDVSIYEDCLTNFGWQLVDQYEFHHAPNVKVESFIVNQQTTKVNGLEMMTLEFKRDRNINKKMELNRLERTCVEALSTINGLERKDEVSSMGVALGSGIVGTVFLAFAVYNFMSANPVAGILLALIGVAGWGIGFFAYTKISRMKTVKTEPIIDNQLNIAYAACEQAHTLLVS